MKMPDQLVVTAVRYWTAPDEPKRDLVKWRIKGGNGPQGPWTKLTTLEAVDAAVVPEARTQPTPWVKLHAAPQAESSTAAELAAAFKSAQSAGLSLDTALAAEEAGIP